MASQFREGAEAGDLVFWDVAQGTITNVTTNARINGRAFSQNSGTSQRSLTATAEFYFHVDIYNNASTHIWRWYSGATELGSLRWNSANRCWDIYTSTTTLSLAGVTVSAPADTNHYVLELHVKIADAGGSIDFKIDGTAQPAFTGDTKPGTATTVDRIGWNVASGSAVIDDLGLNDVSGGADNSWLADYHLYPMTANGNGDNSGFVGSDGNSTDNYLLVDEVPSNADTDYVESATATTKDLYNFTNLPTLPAGSTVTRVIVEARIRQITADADSINLVVKGGTGAGAPSTEAASGNLVLGTSYARFVYESKTNPATTAAWTEAEVNAMQAGFKLP